MQSGDCQLVLRLVESIGLEVVPHAKDGRAAIVVADGDPEAALDLQRQLAARPVAPFADHQQILRAPPPVSCLEMHLDHRRVGQNCRHPPYEQQAERQRGDVLLELVAASPCRNGARHPLAIHRCGVIHILLSRKRFCSDDPSVCLPSVHAGCQLPSIAGLIPKKSMVHCLQTMAHEPQYTQSGSMDRERTLRLRSRLEVTHLALSLPDVLMGHLGPVVLVPPGSMSNRKAEFPAGGSIAPEALNSQHRRSRHRRRRQATRPTRSP